MNLHNVTLEKTAYRPGDYPQRLPEFAFVGRSNVGKSSMLNKLLGRKNLARVSGRAGQDPFDQLLQYRPNRVPDRPAPATALPRSRGRTGRSGGRSLRTTSPPAGISAWSS